MDQQTILSTAFKMTLSLGAVLLVFGVAIFVLRKFSGLPSNLLKKSGRSAIKPLEIIAYQGMGPGRGIYLIRCLEKKILVGATSHGISHLSDIVEDEIEEETEEPAQSSESANFIGSLRRQFQDPAPTKSREIARV